ncbi:MAG: CatB-related O-acetyltransferase [Flavobacteriales bacterium]|nr:CatB-related O-acetyltransferase [Flavobacteriales bacterium]MCB9363340.1 CatB-related O-acetyltransferase [Flavobacteriales bacterium]
MKAFVAKIFKKLIYITTKYGYGESSLIFKFIYNNQEESNLFFNANSFLNSSVQSSTKLYPPYKISNSTIGDYTYISQNSNLNNTSIGKFCSIGPNLMSGWGIHPTNGISTHPMFYSKEKQNGVTLSNKNKIEETKQITIGNDVFIGMNVTIIDGVTISDGAIIGAGAVVSKDIPPYAIAVGSPIKIIKYRFSDDKIEQLLKIKWWDFSLEKLQTVEQDFFDIESFLHKHS